DLEHQLNLSQVEKERSLVLSKLTSRMNAKDISDLMGLSVAYRMGQISHGDFYTALKNLCESHGVKLASTSSLQSYLRYVTMSESIDSDQLLNEIQSKEDHIAFSLARNEKDRELILKSKQLRLTEKLLEFSLTKQEWGEYKSFNDDRENLSSFERFY